MLQFIHIWHLSDLTNRDLHIISQRLSWAHSFCSVSAFQIVGDSSSYISHHHITWNTWDADHCIKRGIWWRANNSVVLFTGSTWFYIPKSEKSGKCTKGAHIHIQWTVNASTPECSIWESIWPWHQRISCLSATENLALDPQRRKLISAYLLDLPQPVLL